MEKGAARRILVMTWGLAMALTFASQLQQNKKASKPYPANLPCPSKFISGTLAFTVLAVLSEFMASVVATMGVGLVLAILIKMASAGELKPPRITGAPFQDTAPTNIIPGKRPGPY